MEDIDWEERFGGPPPVWEPIPHSAHIYGWLRSEQERLDIRTSDVITALYAVLARLNYEHARACYEERKQQGKLGITQRASPGPKAIIVAR